MGWGMMMRCRKWAMSILTTVTSNMFTAISGFTKPRAIPIYFYTSAMNDVSEPLIMRSRGDSYLRDNQTVSAQLTKHSVDQTHFQHIRAVYAFFGAVLAHAKREMENDGFKHS
jgi:hypothetical protein